MTAMCVALDPANGRASMVGAGHPPLLVARRAAAAETVTSLAPPLGLLENSPFVETTIDLQPGDGFLLHTDGLYGPAKTEAERWTPARLQALMDRETTSARALLDRILHRIVPENGEPLADDLAALVVRRAV
jgi:sigma-B regulation protein RsbU (phosphoserine phosphatase)